ncbi:MAG: 23S rRNA (pseudouridine(1915)-N(3))-methyltransferase RlmH [Caulobacterales bacterium]
MRVTILAIGRVRSGPERDLLDDYLDRATASGRALGLGPVAEREAEAPGGADSEAEKILAQIPKGATCILMDERGESQPTRQLASRIARLRDDGVRDLCFIIGGADGHGAAIRDAAVQGRWAKLAFGPQTWPHRLARVMLAEQIYRAISILAGSPYHRD